MTNAFKASLLDRIAVKVSIWGLRRIYGPKCRIDVRVEFPNEPDVWCGSCEAERLIREMQEYVV